MGAKGITFKVIKTEYELEQAKSKTPRANHRKDLEHLIQIEKRGIKNLDAYDDRAVGESGRGRQGVVHRRQPVEAGLPPGHWQRRRGRGLRERQGGEVAPPPPALDLQGAAFASSRVAVAPAPDLAAAFPPPLAQPRDLSAAFPPAPAPAPPSMPPPAPSPFAQQQLSTQRPLNDFARLPPNEPAPPPVQQQDPYALQRAYLQGQHAATQQQQLEMLRQQQEQYDRHQAVVQQATHLQHAAMVQATELQRQKIAQAQAQAQASRPAPAPAPAPRPGPLASLVAMGFDADKAAAALASANGDVAVRAAQTASPAKPAVRTMPITAEPPATKSIKRVAAWPSEIPSPFEPRRRMAWCFARSRSPRRENATSWAQASVGRYGQNK